MNFFITMNLIAVEARLSPGSAFVRVLVKYQCTQAGGYEGQLCFPNCLLLLLRSQLYLWGSPFFRRVGGDFYVCDRFFFVFFFIPAIQIVTFRLRGWCMLGVFFVAGIHPSRTFTCSFCFIFFKYLFKAVQGLLQITGT